MNRLTTRDPYNLAQAVRATHFDMVNKLADYEDIEEQLESVYGQCEGLLQKAVEHLVKHEDAEIGQPCKARLLTDDDVDEWLEYKQLKEQGLLLRLPCKVGDEVYIITTCKDFGKVLDGTLWGKDGGFGTATGYYCPYELNDSCPHEDSFEECDGGCECFENKLAIFEDYIESLMIYADEKVMFLRNCGSASFSDFGRTIFLTKEEAEQKLEEMKGENSNG